MKGPELRLPNVQACRPLRGLTLFTIMRAADPINTSITPLPAPEGCGSGVFQNESTESSPESLLSFGA